MPLHNQALHNQALHKLNCKLTILLAIFSSSSLALCTPDGSPSILMTLLLSESGGIVIATPVSFFTLETENEIKMLKKNIFLFN